MRPKLYILALILTSLAFGAGKKEECSKLTAKLSSYIQDPAEALLKVEQDLLKVTDLLEPDINLFTSANSYQEAELIFQFLARRPIKGGGDTEFKTATGETTLDTPAQQMRDLLNAHIGARELKYEPNHISLVLEDAAKILGEEKPSRRTLHSVALALRLSREYLRRFAPPPAEEKSGEKPEEKKDEKKEDKKKDAKKEKGPQPPPKYPKFEKNSDLKGSDTSGGDGNQEKIVVAEFSGIARLMKALDANAVVRGAAKPLMDAELPGESTSVPPFQHTSEFVTLRKPGDPVVDMLIPSGYEPVSPADSSIKVTRHPTGTYRVETTQDVVQIPVRKRQVSLNPEAREMLLRPVGITEKELPEDLRIFLKGLKGQSDAHIAKEVEKYFQDNYLYNVKGSPHVDVVDAVKSGSFQCKVGAAALVAILRDIFKIPARVALGMRTRPNRKDGQTTSIVEMPGDGHAWVEAYINGRFEEYDPTPKKKDATEENKSNRREDAWESEDSEENPTPPELEEPSEGNSTDKKSHDQEDKDKKDKKSQGDKEKDKDKGKDKKEDKDGRDKGKTLSNEELANQLEIGSISLNREKNKNPFQERMARVALRHALNPTSNRKTNIERLHRLLPFYREITFPELAVIAKEAAQILRGIPGDNVYDAINTIRLSLGRQDVNATYNQVHQLIRYLELYSRLLDSGTPPMPPRDLLKTLYEIRNELQKLSHANAQNIAIVEDFMKDLPNISKQIIREKYNLQNVGPNVQTQKVAKDLLSRGLEPYKLISVLSPLTDFILDSTPDAQYHLARMLAPDTRFASGPDYYIVKNLKDARRATKLQPQKSLEQNFIEGTLFQMKKSQTIQIPEPSGTIDEAERVTIVGYDTSGSMGGEPGDFQAGLIAAFVDRALSDISPTGNYRHKAVLMGFDSDVHTIKQVQNSKEARNVIENYRKELQNTSGGTDIQKFLIQALASIADAQKRNGEPLKKANIVLMTDGEANIDLPKLREAREAIDRNTPVQIMVIFINGSKQELIDFACDSSEGSLFEKGFYREFHGDEISQKMAEATNVKLPPKEEAFFSEKPNTAIPPGVKALLVRGSDQAMTYNGEVVGSTRIRAPQTWLTSVSNIRTPDEDKSKRKIEPWLAGVRGTIQNKIFKDVGLMQTAVNDIMIHFPKIAGAKIEDLTLAEMAHLKWFLGEAEQGPR